MAAPSFTCLSKPAAARGAPEVKPALMPLAEVRHGDVHSSWVKHVPEFDVVLNPWVLSAGHADTFDGMQGAAPGLLASPQIPLCDKEGILEGLVLGEGSRAGSGEVHESAPSSAMSAPSAATIHATNTPSKSRRAKKPSNIWPAPDFAGPSTFSRTMTCEMSLRVLNIPKGMHACLDLGSAYPFINGRRSNRCTIHILSPDGVRHPVSMLSIVGSHHRRLTEGWRSFCRHARVRIGDTVQFCRTDVPGELDTVITRSA